MGKKDDDYEDLSMDLDDRSIGDDLDDDVVVAPVSERPRRGKSVAATPEMDDAGDSFDEIDEVPAPRSARKRTASSTAQGAPASRRKSIIAGTLIGIMVVVGSAGFMYLTMKPSSSQHAVSPFEAAPAPQTALTQQPQPEGFSQDQPLDPALTPAPAEVMVETPSAAIAGGEVSLEHEKLQQATQQAVSAATQDLSNQVLAMGLQIADLQSKLSESSNRSVCDTDAIVEELRRKMKEDEGSSKSVAKAAPKREVAKPAPVVKAPQKKAIDEWKVLGLSSDRAVVVTSKGDQVVVTTGDVVDGVTIKKIDPIQGTVVTNEGTVK